MKKMILSWFVVMVAMLSLPWTASLDAREHKLYVVTTGDVHGAWFNRNYIDGAPDRTSLMSVKYYVDSLRTAVEFINEEGSDKYTYYAARLLADDRQREILDDIKKVRE